MSEYYLAHHGILGQKWGVRRYQNPDGSLTNAGAKRYVKVESKYNRYLSKSKSFDDKISAARKKNRAKIENKISKIEAKRNLENADKLDRKIEKKKAQLKDFDDYTKSVNASAKKYNRIINDYKNAKLTAITDSNYTKTTEYKRIKRAYADQKISDIYYGNQVYTKLFYANDNYRANH